MFLFFILIFSHLLQVPVACNVSLIGSPSCFANLDDRRFYSFQATAPALVPNPSQVLKPAPYSVIVPAYLRRHLAIPAGE